MKVEPVYEFGEVRVIRVIEAVRPGLSAQGRRRAAAAGAAGRTDHRAARSASRQKVDARLGSRAERFSREAPGWPDMYRFFIQAQTRGGGEGRREKRARAARAKRAHQ